MPDSLDYWDKIIYNLSEGNTAKALEYYLQSLDMAMADGIEDGITEGIEMVCDNPSEYIDKETLIDESRE